MATGSCQDMTTGVASSHPDRFQNAPRAENLSVPSARSTVDLEAGTRVAALVREVDEAELRMHAGIYATLQAFVTAFIDGPFAEIAGDRGLSPEGKAAARRKAGELALQARDNYGAQASTLREAVKVADESLVKVGRTEKPADLSDAEWETHQAAVRAHVATVADPLARQGLYSQALDEGNLAVLAAIESMGPVIGPTGRFEAVVDPSLVREKRLARGRARFPEAAAERDKNARLAITHGDAARLINTEVRRLAGLDDRQVVLS